MGRVKQDFQLEPSAALWLHEGKLEVCQIAHAVSPVTCSPYLAALCFSAGFLCFQDISSRSLFGFL